MAVNKAHGGYQKVAKEGYGILWFGDAATVAAEEIDGSTDLSTIAGLTDVAVTNDGIKKGVEAEDIESLKDSAGTVFDSTDPNSTYSLEFSIMEVLSAKKAELYKAAEKIVTDATSGRWTELKPGGVPSNKVFYLDIRVKNIRIRHEIIEASYAGEQEVTINDNGTGAEQPCKYSILTLGSVYTHDLTTP